MKLFVTDLDGTLYPKKEVLNPNQFQDNLTAIKQWIDSGNKFAVATARGLHHYEVLCNKIGLNPIFIGSNGAAVRYEDGEVCFKTVSIQIFIDLCNLVKDNHINASVATGINNQWVWSSKDCYPIRDANPLPTYLNDIVIPQLDEIDLSYEVERIQVLVPSENRDQLKALIIEQNYPVSITTSDVDLIDIGPMNSSKGIAILEICQHFGIDRDHLVVAGDSENDVAMFEVTNHSYCIDHAETEVKNKAKFVVSTVEEVIQNEI